MTLSGDLYKEEATHLGLLLHNLPAPPRLCSSGSWQHLWTATEGLQFPAPLCQILPASFPLPGL